MNDNRLRGLLIVLSSPSGGGKTSVYEELLKRFPQFKYSVSATTRPKRANEIDGESYHFLDREEFIRKRDAGDFAEWAEVYGNYYGTYKDFIDSSLQNGDVILLDLDIQGAANLSSLYEEAVTVFILPPSLKVLEKRLINRKTDDPEVCKRRLQEAIKEIAEWPNYNYVVINDILDDAVEDVAAIIKAESLNSSRFPEKYFENKFFK